MNANADGVSLTVSNFDDYVGYGCADVVSRMNLVKNMRTLTNKIDDVSLTHLLEGDVQFFTEDRDDPEVGFWQFVFVPYIENKMVLRECTLDSRRNIVTVQVEISNDDVARLINLIAEAR